MQKLRFKSLLPRRVVATAIALSLLVAMIAAVFCPAVASAAGPVTLFNAVHQGQQQGNWNVGLWKYKGDGTGGTAVNNAGSSVLRWGPNGLDGWTHSFTLTYDPATYALSFSVVNESGTKTVTISTTSPVVPPEAPGPVNNLHMVIAATAGTLVQCANQASMPKQQVNSSKTTVSDLKLDSSSLDGLEVEAKLVDNPTSTSFTNKVEVDIPVPGNTAWTLTGKITVAFDAPNMAYPPKTGAIGMPQLNGQYVIVMKETSINWDNPADIVYGTALSGTQLNAAATAGGNPVDGTFVYTPVEGTVLNAGSGQTLHVDFTPTDPTRYTSAEKDVTINVLSKDASVTPNAASKTYGELDPAFSGTLEGFLAGDDVTATYSRASGETVAGSPYTISATLSPTGVLGNYNISYNTAEFNIGKKDASVTPDAASKIYGDSDPTLTGTLADFLPADGVSATYSRASGENVAGSPYTISATLSPTGVLGNYNITCKTADFSITKAALNIKADDKSKAFGAALPTLTVTYTGLTNGDIAPATPPTISTTATASSPVGTYPITATGAADTNYTITYTAGTLKVNKAGTTVALTSSDNPSYFLQRVTFTATVTAAAPGAGTPTGTVTFKDTFKDGTTMLGTGTLDSSGKATYITPCLRPLCLGGHSITAVYSGDANFTTSTSPVLTQTVLSWCQWFLRLLSGCS